MASVVQATCPGCKRTLRIPADWSSKAIRCKHCGAVLQAKAPAKPAAARPASPVRTPPPARKAPVAVPVAVAASRVGPRRARRGGSPWWIGPAVALTILVVAGVAGVIAWPYVSAALYPKATTTADAGSDPKDVSLTTTPSSKPNPNESSRPSDAKGQVFPRRALVISVHNYLYANPIHAGMPLANARNIPEFPRRHEPRPAHSDELEMAQLSDEAAGGAEPVRP